MWKKAFNKEMEHIAKVNRLSQSSMSSMGPEQLGEGMYGLAQLALYFSSSHRFFGLSKIHCLPICWSVLEAWNNAFHLSWLTAKHLKSITVYFLSTQTKGNLDHTSSTFRDERERECVACFRRLFSTPTFCLPTCQFLLSLNRRVRGHCPVHGVFSRSPDFWKALLTSSGHDRNQPTTQGERPLVTSVHVASWRSHPPWKSWASPKCACLLVHQQSWPVSQIWFWTIRNTVKPALSDHRFKWPPAFSDRFFMHGESVIQNDLY